MGDQSQLAEIQKRRALRKQKKQRRKQMIFRVSITTVLLIIMSAGMYAAYLLATAQNTANYSFRPISNLTAQQKKAKYSVNPITDPICILIMGIDDNEERQLGNARTDALILLTMNPQTEAINMVSIPRDTYVKLATGKNNSYGKINSAYSAGKEEASVETVENLMNVPVNFYFTFDFEAFQKIVDALGGITLNVDLPEEVEELNADGTGRILLKPGEQTLNGEEALALARTRYVDNDIMRGKRQQDIIQAIIKKAANIGSINKYTKVLEALDDHMWTDMPTNTMTAVFQTILTKNFTTNTFVFEWKNFDLGDESMVALYGDSLDYISHKLRVSLNLEEKDRRDAADFKFETDGIVSEKTPEPNAELADSSETSFGNTLDSSENSLADTTGAVATDEQEPGYSNDSATE